LGGPKRVGKSVGNTACSDVCCECATIGTVFTRLIPVGTGLGMAGASADSSCGLVSLLSLAMAASISALYISRINQYVPLSSPEPPGTWPLMCDRLVGWAMVSSSMSIGDNSHRLGSDSSNFASAHVRYCFLNHFFDESACRIPFYSRCQYEKRNHVEVGMDLPSFEFTVEKPLRVTAFKVIVQSFHCIFFVGELLMISATKLAKVVYGAGGFACLPFRSMRRR